MPPAASSGIRTARRTWGVRTIVGVSSRPLCPPASNPSATTASTPASSLLRANFELDTTCATLQPASCSCAVRLFGSPAEVKTTGTRSSMTVSMIWSAYRYMSGTFTPKGFRVASRQRRICSRSRSGVIEPEPISPRPPASLTAAASRQPLHQIMPPATMG